MGNHYRVKFINGGQLCYGIVETYSEEARKLALENKLLVEDAIYPQCWELAEKDVSDVPFGKYDDKDEYWQYIKKMLDNAQKLSDSLLGCVPGKLVIFQVADGCAYYVITRVNKKTVKLEWRGFCMDRYTEPVLGLEGVMDRSRCEKLIGYEEKLFKLFK